MRHSLVWVLLLGFIAGAKAATPEPADLCMSAVAGAEKLHQTPPRMLGAIATAESGRVIAGRVAPWPWTIDVAGEGKFFATKAEAVEAVQSLQAAGVQSIDVGCMQINLMQHPHAFGSLDEAFDPVANAQYGAQFLSELHHELADWDSAVAAYHSRTAAIGVSYAQRVLAIMPGAAQPHVALDPALVSAPVIDPYHVRTKSFDRVIAANDALRARRLAAMGLTHSAIPTRLADRGAAARRPGARTLEGRAIS